MVERRRAHCTIAAESRRASALVDGLPNPGPGPAGLPEAAVYAVHKLIGDLSNVSREWYEETINAENMSDAHYIGLMGVLVHVWSVDEFHRALGLEIEPLPDPIPGEPARRRPSRPKTLPNPSQTYTEAVPAQPTYSPR